MGTDATAGMPVMHDVIAAAMTADRADSRVHELLQSIVRLVHTIEQNADRVCFLLLR